MSADARIGAGCVSIAPGMATASRSRFSKHASADARSREETGIRKPAAIAGFSLRMLCHRRVIRDRLIGTRSPGPQSCNIAALHAASTSDRKSKPIPAAAPSGISRKIAALRARQAPRQLRGFNSPWLMNTRNGPFGSRHPSVRPFRLIPGERSRPVSRSSSAFSQSATRPVNVPFHAPPTSPRPSTYRRWHSHSRRRSHPHPHRAAP